MSAKRERTTSLDLAGVQTSAPVSLLLAEPAHRASGVMRRGKRQASTAGPGRGDHDKRKRGERADSGEDVHYLVSRLLAEGDDRDTEDTLIRVCGALQEAMGWDEVTFWPSDGRAAALRSVRGVDVRAQAVAVSTATADSGHTPAPLVSRIAVVGHVFATGKPAYLTDMASGSALLDTTPAVAGGRSSAFAFPVWGMADLLGVMECLSATPRSPDATRLRKAAALGATIGRFIERRREQGEAQRRTPHAERATEQATSAEAPDRAHQLEAAFDALADSVLIFDREGHIVCANAVDRAMLGYDARSTSFTTSLHERGKLLMARDERGEPIAEDRMPFARILRGEVFVGQRALDATLRAADGRELQVRTSGAPLVDDSGHLIGGVVVTRDLTEQRRRERRLRDANRRMQEFLAVAAHDLRTPITASKGYVQLAVRRLNKLEAAATTAAPALVGGIEQVRKTLEDAEHSAQRLARLVDRLLDVAHIQANKLELRPEAVDLATIIYTKVHEQRLATPTRAIRYKVRPIRAVPALADPDRIGQVLLNFLANALKYSPDESVVEVTLGVRAGQARVSVRDTGSGIPDAEQERIWRRFEQLDDSQRRGSGAGLGLGLYISRAIVEAHGGHAGVQSSVGQGSTFWFDLPLARGAE